MSILGNGARMQGVPCPLPASVVFAQLVDQRGAHHVDGAGRPIHLGVNLIQGIAVAPPDVAAGTNLIDAVHLIPEVHRTVVGDQFSRIHVFEVRLAGFTCGQAQASESQE